MKKKPSKRIKELAEKIWQEGDPGFTKRSSFSDFVYAIYAIIVYLDEKKGNK